MLAFVWKSQWKLALLSGEQQGFQVHVAIVWEGMKEQVMFAILQVANMSGVWENGERWER